MVGSSTGGCVDALPSVFPALSPSTRSLWMMTMAESIMAVIERSRKEESMSCGKDDESMEIFERKKRCVGDKMSFTRYNFLSPDEMVLSNDFITNPPKIANLLEFTVRIKKNDIVKLTDKINNGVSLMQLEDIEKHTKDLAQIISTDPRMSDNLDYDLFIHLFRFLEFSQNPNIQSPAIIILRTYIAYTINNQWVMDSIKASTLIKLIGSEDCEVKVQGMCLLRTMALTIPNPQFNETLELALEPLSLLIQGDTIDEVLNSVSETLAVVCEVYPMLPSAKLKMVVNSLLKLFSYESSKVPPHACLGLLYLCDGRQEMVVGRKDVEPLIDSLIQIVKLHTKLYADPDLHLKVTAALIALGTIVRWGSDDDIEVIIVKKDALQILGRLLQKKNRDFVENACWIISNITAGKENHIMAVISSGLIERLFDVIENYKLVDVKKEAAWAISNALHGVCPDELKGLRSRCLEPLWSILKVFRADQQIVSFCLEGLVNLDGAKVHFNDNPISAEDFKKLFVILRGAKLLSHEVWVAWIRKLYLDTITFDVICTFKEDMQQYPYICLVYASLETYNGLGYSLNTADDMEVEEPKGVWC